MSQEKQIEELAWDLCDIPRHPSIKSCDECGNKYCHAIYYAKKAINKGYHKQSEWISTKDRLPNEGEQVLIYAGEIAVAKLIRGISKEERLKMKNGEMIDPIEWGWSLSTGLRELKRSDIYRAEDEGFNNLKPFRFVGNGNAQWCGQNVTHWMPLPEPPQMKGGAE